LRGQAQVDFTLSVPWCFPAQNSLWAFMLIPHPSSLALSEVEVHTPEMIPKAGKSLWKETYLFLLLFN
jgi:hypothetical protein